MTSENLAEFNRDRLRLAPEPAVAPAKEAGEPAVESEAKKTAENPEAETDEQLGKIPDPEAKQKIQGRFSDLSKARDAAKAEADAAKAERAAAVERAEKAERAAAELRTKYERPKVDGPGPEPQRAQFANDDEHRKALIDWAGDKAIHERSQQERSERQAKAWDERQVAARAEIPTYDADLAAGANLMVSNEVRDAIIESEQGPKILHYLTKNAAFVEELSRDTATRALFKIGKLEAKFEAEKAKPAPAAETKEPAKPAAAATEISRAPAPITRLQPVVASAEIPVDAKGEFYGTAEQYRALRKAGKI